MRNRSLPAAVGSALLFVCGGGVAHADDATAGRSLPTSGTAFSIAEDGDMIMECDGVVHRIEVRGAGQLRVGDRIAGDQPTASVRTVAEQLNGYDADLGAIAVSERGPAAGEFEAPSAGREFPATEAFAQDVTVAMQHSPCAGGQPAVYASKAAFPLLNTDLTTFPPKNSVYQLVSPVELADVSDPSAPSFTLTSFAVTVTRSP
jgi:hypothetical protein